MKQLILATLFVLVLLLPYGCGENASPDMKDTSSSGSTLSTGMPIIKEPGTKEMEVAEETGQETAQAENKVIVFTLTGENFKFVMDRRDNPKLRVKQGDTVRIEFSSIQGLHDWAVDEFNARTERVNDGDMSVSVEFVADKTGEFEYYCSGGNHRASGMKGKLVVE